jgi:hypothetical protein
VGDQRSAAPIARLRADGYDLTMAVNLGARCLAEGSRLFETADELIRRWDIPPDKLLFLTGVPGV